MQKWWWLKYTNYCYTKLNVFDVFNGQTNRATSYVSCNYQTGHAFDKVSRGNYLIIVVYVSSLIKFRAGADAINISGLLV